MSNTLSPQAKNSIELLKGNSVETIKIALKQQRISVVEELQKHYGVDSIDTLATKISQE